MSERVNTAEELIADLKAPFAPLEKAQKALSHLDQFADESPYHDQSALFMHEDDCLYELPHDEGQFNLAGFRQLVKDFTELKHRMDGLEK